MGGADEEPQSPPPSSGTESGNAEEQPGTAVPQQKGGVRWKSRGRQKGRVRRKGRGRQKGRRRRKGRKRQRGRRRGNGRTRKKGMWAQKVRGPHQDMEVGHPRELPMDVWRLIWGNLSVSELAKAAAVAKAWRDDWDEREAKRRAAALALVTSPDATPDLELAAPQRVLRAIRRHLVGLDAFAGDPLFGPSGADIDLEKDNFRMLRNGESAVDCLHLAQGNSCSDMWYLYMGGRLYMVLFMTRETQLSHNDPPLASTPPNAEKDLSAQEEVGRQRKARLQAKIQAYMIDVEIKEVAEAQGTLEPIGGIPVHPNSFALMSDPKEVDEENVIEGKPPHPNPFELLSDVCEQVSNVEIAGGDTDELDKRSEPDLLEEGWDVQLDLHPRTPEECEWMQGLLLALSEGSLGEPC